MRRGTASLSDEWPIPPLWPEEYALLWELLGLEEFKKVLQRAAATSSQRSR